MGNLIPVIIAFVYGTAIGSFLNVIIWRLPRGRSLRGRSHCPHCRAKLGPANLVPLLSYAVLRGRCANCHRKISVRYPLIEGATGLLFALAAAHLISPGAGVESYLELLRWLFVISILVAVFVIDLEHYLILDNIVFPAAAIVLVLNIAIDIVNKQALWSPGSHTGGGVIAAILAAGFFYALWAVSAGRWMGFGDVKLNIVLGLVLGPAGVAVGLFLAFIIGAAVGLCLIVFRLKALQSRIPFGTFLSIGTILAMFYGPSIARWYLGLVGWR